MQQIGPPAAQKLNIDQQLRRGSSPARVGKVYCAVFLLNNYYRMKTKFQ